MYDFNDEDIDRLGPIALSLLHSKSERKPTEVEGDQGRSTEKPEVDEATDLDETPSIS